MNSAKWRRNLVWITTATNQVSHRPIFSKHTTIATPARRKAANGLKIVVERDAFAIRSKLHTQPALKAATSRKTASLDTFVETQVQLAHNQATIGASAEICARRPTTKTLVSAATLVAPTVTYSADSISGVVAKKVHLTKIQAPASQSLPLECYKRSLVSVLIFNPDPVMGLARPLTHLGVCSAAITLTVTQASPLASTAILTTVRRVELRLKNKNGAIQWQWADPTSVRSPAIQTFPKVEPSVVHAYGIALRLCRLVIKMQIVTVWNAWAKIPLKIHLSLDAAYAEWADRSVQLAHKAMRNCQSL